MTERIYLNGIDAKTGEYLVPPLKVEEVAALAGGEAAETDRRLVGWLKALARRLGEVHLGLPFDVDPVDVPRAGWTIVFHRDEADAVKKALEPLVEHRLRRVGKERTHVLDYATDEPWRTWLTRHGVEPGNVDPAKIGYYVVLVGDPTLIPYSFQALLDVEYGVGRICFDSAAEYERYAEAVIAYETGERVPNSRTVAFFGTRHAGDRATELSSDLLVAPLASTVAQRSTFDVRTTKPDGATKAALSSLLAGEGEGGLPALCFTATHGMGFDSGTPGQLESQGALLCQDWPGFGQIAPAHYFAAEDVPSNARLQGMVLFHFACFGAGTPERDEFLRGAGAVPPTLAERPFVAALPKALLAHPEGPALAVIGHVERAWTYSFVSAAAGPQLRAFENTLGGLLRGWPVGYAVKDFAERFAVLSAGLSGMLEEMEFGGIHPPAQLASTWVERNDARNYVILGDPAVRLRVDALGAATGPAG